MTFNFLGARERIRTSTPLQALAPQASLATDYSTRAANFNQSKHLIIGHFASVT